MITDPFDRVMTAVVALFALIIGASILAATALTFGSSPWLLALGVVLQPVVGMLRNAL